MKWTQTTAVAGLLLLGTNAAFAATAQAGGTRPATTPDTTPDDTPAAGGTASPEFCDAFITVDLAFTQVPEDPALIEDFLAAEVVPFLPVVRDNAPADIATEVGVMVDGGELAVAGDPSALESPEQAAVEAVVYPALEAACGLPAVTVSAVDFAFDGVPETLATGPTVFVMHNDSEAGEFHLLVIFKLNEGDDVTLDDFLAIETHEEAMVHVASESAVAAQPGGASGTIVDLAPGRYVYICPVAVGSVHGEEGTGPPHFLEGMSGEFVVE